MKRLVVIGAGGHGRSVAEAAAASGEYTITGFLDDAHLELTQVWSIPVLGALGEYARWHEEADFVVVAIGNNRLRQRLTEELQAAGFVLATIIHPRAVVSPTASIGAGCTIMAGAIIGTEACVGEGVIVNAGAIVDHHAKVGDFGHLGVRAAMAGGSVLGHGAWMQAGAALGYGVTIPEHVVLQPGEARST